MRLQTKPGTFKVAVEEGTEEFNATTPVTRMRANVRKNGCPPLSRRQLPKRGNRQELPPTIVAAKIDIGFGNTLFIRGEGHGLSWDHGQPLVCTDGTTWIWSRPARDEAVLFKLLINDQLWSRGENMLAESSRRTEVKPVF